MKEQVLTLSCPDGYGIVAAVTGFLSSNEAFILESAQSSDQDTERFFLRIRFRAPDTLSGQSFDSLFRDVAEKFDMDWQLHEEGKKPRVLIMVSKAGHCLNNLLHHAHSGNLPVTIAGVASNHTNLEEMASWYKVPFYHLPVTADTKEEQEKKLMRLVESIDIDTVVLARYMQILSPYLVENLYGRCINIHHSFLPGFKGARPYHQAYDRGVKIIGATAHYVTDDLDEGPIIEQEVQRVDHSYSPKDLAAVGRDIESLVLLRALKLHADNRVFINGNKTVIFK